MYRMNAVYAGMRFVGVPLARRFQRSMRRRCSAAIERERPALVCISRTRTIRPAICSTAGEVEAIIRAAPGLVVRRRGVLRVRRCELSAAAAELPNLLVLRTMSKVGHGGPAAGLRGRPHRSGSRNSTRLRQPYNVNALTQAAVERCSRTRRGSTSRRERFAPSARGSPRRSRDCPA